MVAGKNLEATRKDVQRDLLSAYRRQRKLEDKIKRLRARLQELTFEIEAKPDLPDPGQEA
jgi:hypothetical protein